MIYWYRATCYEHKETIDLFVDSPTTTGIYLGKNDAEIKAWLLQHHGCKLELSTEADPDRVWNAGCWDPIRKLPPSADPSKIKAQPAAAIVDPMTEWGPLRGECFDLLGFALLYMDYLESDWPRSQRDRVIALCREVAANQHEPSLTYWRRMRERIVDETENMC